jgi:hypothetical protein
MTSIFKKIVLTWGFAQVPYMQHLLDCFEIVISLGNQPRHDIWERKETCYDPPHCMTTTPKGHYYVLQGLNFFYWVDEISSGTQFNSLGSGRHMFTKGTK